MDFKNYVRMMLEADKAKDQDEEVENQDDEEDSDKDEEEDDDEKEASVKTKACRNGCEPSVKSTCNGCEPSVEDDEEDDEDEDEDEDDEEEKCPKCGKSPCECKKEKSLKESMLHLASDNHGKKVITEEEEVLCENIKNNSASKYLAKLAKRAEKEAAKYEKKGWKEEAKTSKKAATSLKEASNKLYKCETRYQNGDASAKREYKSICKQYSKELKALGRTAKGLKGLLFTLLAGTVLLGGVGLTIVNNDKIIERLQYGFEHKEEMPSVLKQIGKNDKSFIDGVLKGSEVKTSDWGGDKAELEAHRLGWDSVEEHEAYTAPWKKAKQFGKDVAEGFKKPYKAAGEVAGKIGKGAKEVYGK